MLLRKIPFVGAFVLSLGVVGFSQQPAPPAAPPPVDRAEGFKDRHRGGPGLRRREMRLRLQRELNLTDAQRNQLRELRLRQFESTRSIREDLFKLREKRRAGTFSDEDATRAQTLRQQMRDAMKGSRKEFQNVLTPEQRDQLEQFRRERQQRREEIRQRLPEFRKQNPL
jgi:Spy/CpxP family protein refolding chaperone